LRRDVTGQSPPSSPGRGAHASLQPQQALEPTIQLAFQLNCSERRIRFRNSLK
jgi:hypothetical protein